MEMLRGGRRPDSEQGDADAKTKSVGDCRSRTRQGREKAMGELTGGQGKAAPRWCEGTGFEVERSSGGRGFQLCGSMMRGAAGACPAEGDVGLTVRGAQQHRGDFTGGKSLLIKGASEVCSRGRGFQRLRQILRRSRTGNARPGSRAARCSGSPANRGESGGGLAPVVCAMPRARWRKNSPALELCRPR